MIFKRKFLQNCIHVFACRVQVISSIDAVFYGQKIDCTLHILVTTNMGQNLSFVVEADTRMLRLMSIKNNKCMD